MNPYYLKIVVLRLYLIGRSNWSPHNSRQMSCNKSTPNATACPKQNNFTVAKQTLILQIKNIQNYMYVNYMLIYKP